MPKVISSAIEILKITLALLKTLKKKMGKTKDFNANLKVYMTDFFLFA